MTISLGTAIRTGLLVLLGVVIQISGLSQIRVLGAAPDVTPLIVAAVALFAGSVPGAVTGFCVGLLLDLALGQNVGSSSLVLTAVGYGVGRYGELRDPAHGLIAIPVGAAATPATWSRSRRSASCSSSRPRSAGWSFGTPWLPPSSMRSWRCRCSAASGACCGRSCSPSRAAGAGAPRPRPTGPIGLRGLEV